MSRLTVAALAGCLLLGAALWLSLGHASRQSEARRRAEADRSALLAGMARYRVRDSLNAVSVEALTLTVRELRTRMSSTAELVRDMGVKLRRVESLAVVAAESDYAVTAPVRDSVVMRGDSAVNICNIYYKDNWLELDGTVEGGLFRGSVASCDTLTQVVERIPRRFLFFRWGTRGFEQHMVSSNPHTRITYSRYIRLK